MKNAEFTHLTKHGAGRLLNANILCSIIKEQGESVVIKCVGGNIYHVQKSELKKRSNHPLEALANKVNEMQLSVNDSTQLQLAVNSLSFDDSHNLIEYINRCEGADHYERANEAFKQLVKYL